MSATASRASRRGWPAGGAWWDGIDAGAGGRRAATLGGVGAARETLAAEPTFRLVARAVDTGLLALPWHEPLEEWRCANLVDLERGISRHVVRFVELGGSYYALKELPPRLAEREYRLLRSLVQTNVPAVDPVGVVVDRRAAGDPQALDAVLVTRYLDFSLPFRIILGRRVLPAAEAVLLEALAGLLVRLHLAGFFWGDCSLSNTLFRRDAGGLEAYLVDVETGELHDRLTDGQRRHDLELAYDNLSFELYDLGTELGWDEERDPGALADEVLERYDRLWGELTNDEVFGADETSRLEARLRQLNELGYDVEEIEVVKSEREYRLRLHSQAVESGHHRRRLLRLTGLDAQENQARRLLRDIADFRAARERRGEPAISEAASAGRWLSEVFEPAIAAIPRELRAKRAAAELFHEVLEHRWFLSERAGREVSTDEALASYVDTVLRPAPDERTALLRGAGGGAP
jgi:hypothetical protein